MIILAWLSIFTCSVVVLSGAELKEDRFYIYDWPSLDGRSTWPLPNRTLVSGKAYRLDFQHVHSMNYGAGEELDASQGLYSTNPYHLYQLIMSRLRVHPLRVLDKSQANLFFVPYDIGVVSQWDTHTGVYNMHQVHGCSAVDEVSSLLVEAVASSPLHGHDLVVINSLFGVMNFNCYKILCLCPSCARLSSEPSRAKIPLQYNLPTALYKYGKKRNISFPYGTFGVPIPAAIHYNEEMKTPYPWSDWEAEKAILVTGWFSRYVQNKVATTLRHQLYHQCAKHFDQCAFVEIYERSGHQAKTVRLSKSSHTKVWSASASNVTLTNTFKSGFDFYRHSRFCLHPPGDMEMRKGMFDSMLLGCIPVLFLPDILSRKYPWYFTPEIERAVSVNVKLSSITNIVKYLEAIPPEVVTQKRKALSELAASLSYAIPPLALRSYVGVNMKGPRDGEATWQPPFRDATDVMLTGLFRRVRRFAASGGVVPPEEKLVSKSDFSLYWL